MNEFTIISTSLEDFFTKPIIKIALYPLIITMFILYMMFFTAADIGINSLENQVIHVESSQTSVDSNGVVNSSESSETYVGQGIVDFLLKYSLTSWLASFLIYTMGSIIVMMFSVFISLLIIGFLTPMILTVIQKRHYPTLEFKGYGSLYSVAYVSIKSIMVMIFLFIVLIPFYFIPLFNIIAFNLPLYYLFHKLLNFDVISTVMTKEESYYLKAKYSGLFRIRTLLLYFISMIPFITLFSTVFYIVYLGHGYMSKLEELRASDNYLALNEKTQ